MSRPAVDVVVPFVGSDEELADLLARLDALELADGDSLTVVDNGRAARAADPRVIAAPQQQSSYYARNRGAERGSAPWLLFIDADVEPPRDLVDRYFDAEPADNTAVLAGAVEDAPPGGDP